MSARARLAAVAAGAALLGASPAARAQFPGDIPRSIGETPSPTTGIEISQKLPYWGAGRTRTFVATTFEAGVVNLRETISVGYGRPHWRWFGVEAYTTVATQGGLEYGGVHVSLPNVELRSGVRYAFDLEQFFLPVKDTYFRDDVLRELGPKQHYLTAETEIAAALPLPHSSLFGVGTVGYLTDIPSYIDAKGKQQSYRVFEDVLHGVFEPPWYVRGRVGYFWRFGFDENLKLGGAVEAIYNPGRDTLTMRAGPIFALTLSHHLDASASFMIVAASNDRLGLLGGEFTTIGFRYRWATGDRWPEFP